MIHWSQEYLRRVFKEGHTYWDDLPLSEEKCISCKKTYMLLGLSFFSLCPECQSAIISPETKREIIKLETRLTVERIAREKNG